MRKIDIIKDFVENYQNIDRAISINISEESAFLALIKQDLEWEYLSAPEKQQKRKMLFKYMNKMETSIETLKEIFKLEICIIEFYDILQNALDTLELMNKNDVSVTRLKAMLFIERIFLNEYLDVKKIRHHNFSLLNGLLNELLNNEKLSILNIKFLNQKLIEKENLLNEIDTNEKE